MEWALTQAKETNEYIGSRQYEFRNRSHVYRERESKRVRSNEYRQRAQAHRENDLWSRRFVGWDSEGDNRDRSVFLFGSSDGDRIAHPAIRSTEFFECLLNAEARDPNAIHIIFGGEYDFNMFLRDLPLRCLCELRDTSRTKWRGFKLEHVPRKWFTVSRDGLVARLFDIQLFFGTSYVAAIGEHGIGDSADHALIKSGKADRSAFGYEHLSRIEPYWKCELKLLPQLADKLREAFYNAGMFITSWHGPGALARNILTNRKIKDHMAETPESVYTASRYAFCGGRFESFRAGLYEGTVYNADINSAYPYATTFLPSLTHGKWRYTTMVDRANIVPTQFALYHIRYRTYNTEGLSAIRSPKPLFRRFHDDRVMWTNHSTGWYWSPEAALVAEDSHAEFLEAWIFDDDGQRPFAFLQEYYDIRARLKAQNNPMQLSFKLGPNSVYGQLAQRAGWERNNAAPRFHQLEWAGFVTSMCRAMVYRLAMYAWQRNALISIDTDGVYATCDLRNVPGENYGKGLGQWDHDTTLGILYWQSGVYYIPDESGQWQLKKARGAPKGQIPYDKAIAALDDLRSIQYLRNEFLGYRYCLKTSMDDWRYFREKQRKLDFGGSAFSKRWHNIRACRKCQGIGYESMHDLFPASNLMQTDTHSKMHVIPWRENDHDRESDPIDEKSDVLIDAIWSDEP